MSKREIWIDNLKAFTIFAVIVGHCIDGYLKADMFPEASNAFYGIWYFIYSYHMPLFFMISGYTFSLAYLDSENKLKTQRFVRQLINILLLYVIWALLLWGAKMCVSQFVNTKYSVNDLIHMFINPLGNYWYLYILCILYILTGVLQIYKWNKIVSFSSTAIIAVVVGYFLLNGMHYTIYRIFYNIFFFITGIILCVKPKISSNKAVFGASLAVALGLWAVCIFTGFDIQNDPIAHPLMALAMSIIFIYLFKSVIKTDNKFLKLCGQNCIYIYLIHPYITAGNRQFLPMIGIHNAWISLIVNIAMALIISAGLSFVCNKLAVTDILFKPIKVFENVKYKISK
ncbi:MAG: acyltransferase family protein [Candidatus Ornithomonoglobus sp.]